MDLQHQYGVRSSCGAAGSGGDRAWQGLKESRQKSQARSNSENRTSYSRWPTYKLYPCQRSSPHHPLRSQLDVAVLSKDLNATLLGWSGPGLFLPVGSHWLDWHPYALFFFVVFLGFVVVVALGSTASSSLGFA